MFECPIIHKCGFFREFSGDSDVVKQGWVSMYCHSELGQPTCKRLQYLNEHGESPPPNMSPTGKML